MSDAKTHRARVAACRAEIKTAKLIRPSKFVDHNTPSVRRAYDAMGIDSEGGETGPDRSTPAQVGLRRRVEYQDAKRNWLRNSPRGTPFRYYP